jgi:putative phosphotransacetylase
VIRECELASIVAAKLTESGFIEVEASARHVHLCKADAEALFGKGIGPAPVRALSQRGEFLCEERVAIVGGRRAFQNVAVLGPLREHSQVELSLTDGVALGVKLPVRDSGDVMGSPGILLRSAKGEVSLPYGCIAARRHLHASPREAELLGLNDKQIVSIEVFGSRRVVFCDVLVRVKDSFRLKVHLDMDEVNAAGIDGFAIGRLVEMSFRMNEVTEESFVTIRSAIIWIWLLPTDCLLG